MVVGGLNHCPLDWQSGTLQHRSWDLNIQNLFKRQAFCNFFQTNTC